MLKGKKVILGITGSIAAYKSASLIRLLIKEGAEVRVIITSYGREFITPLTLSTLSGNPVLTDFFEKKDGDWHSHVDLGLWADIFLIAPATANTMAKMAAGVCDNLLLTTYLSARCPIVLAPAMDLDMFQHPATLKNIETLKSFGNSIIEPAVGELASGLEGKGRMEEPEKILHWLIDYFQKKKRFAGKRILITAGPTFEKIDPVRYIGNFSSGKMGIALANSFVAEGAEVSLVAGPIDISSLSSDVEHIPVISAREMYDACLTIFPDIDVAVMNAAVSDFRPDRQNDSKIKRSGDNLKIELIPNPDIAASLGEKKRSDQLIIGFALETDDGVNAAIAKKKKKNFDMIILNSLLDKGAGFGGDTNRITIIGKDNKPRKFELKSKKMVAKDIIDSVFSIFEK